MFLACRDFNRIVILLRTRSEIVSDWCEKPQWMWHKSLHWRHNGHDSVSNHQPRDCLLNRLLRHRSCNIWDFAYSAYPFLLWWLWEYYTLSYYHHQIGSMIHLSLYRVRSWNNGMCCMSFYILKCDFTASHAFYCCYSARNPISQYIYETSWWPLSPLSIYFWHLTHWGRVTHICVSKLEHHWFR